MVKTIRYKQTSTQTSTQSSLDMWFLEIVFFVFYMCLLFTTMTVGYIKELNFLQFCVCVCSGEILKQTLFFLWVINN